MNNSPYQAKARSSEKRPEGLAERLALLPESLSVWRFGSVARGDSDEWSDEDILVVCDEEDYPQLRSADITQRHTGVSVYSLPDIARMRRSGSLFLHHLRCEGIEIHAKSTVVVDALVALPAYRNAQRDVSMFTLTLQDVERSLRRGGVPSYELIVAATTLRHAAILVCNTFGVRLFDWKRSIPMAFNLVGRPNQAGKGLQVYERKRQLAHNSHALQMDDLANARLAVSLGIFLLRGFQDAR